MSKWLPIWSTSVFHTEQFLCGTCGFVHALTRGFIGKMFKLGVIPGIARLFWHEISQVLNLSPKHLKCRQVTHCFLVLQTCLHPPPTGTSPQLHTWTIRALSVVPSALHLLLITKSGETGLGLTRLWSHLQLAPALLSGGNNVGSQENQAWVPPSRKALHLPWFSSSVELRPWGWPRVTMGEHTQRPSPALGFGVPPACDSPFPYSLAYSLSSLPTRSPNSKSNTHRWPPLEALLKLSSP